MKQLIFSSIIIICLGLSCHKQPSKPSVGCESCGLKAEGKKYQKIKKSEKRKKP